jgi:hypothetical protein
MDEPAKHDANTYRNGRCRCEVCREDHRVKTAANRKARLAQGVIHGSRSSYDAGCRCDYCLGARRLAYARERGYPVVNKAGER